VIHTVKGFSKVNVAEVFLEFSCFFYDPSTAAAAAAKSLQSWYMFSSVVSFLRKIFVGV